MNIAIIPARGGSKRIPRKNIVDFGGKPLLAWSVEAGLASGAFDSVFVSTDDPEIAAAAIAVHTGLHHPVRGWQGFVSNLAIPFSPAVFDGGPVYEWSVNHLVAIDDPVAPFRTVGPRPVLMNTAVFFIWRKCFSISMPSASGVAGACMDTKSDWLSTSSSEQGSTPCSTITSSSMNGS